MKIIPKLKENIYGPEDRNVEEELRHDLKISNKIIALGLFAALAWPKLEVSTYLKGYETDPKKVVLDRSFKQFADPAFYSAIWHFLVDKGPIAALAVLTWRWYTVYQKAVYSEMDILTSTFSKKGKPHDLDQLTGRNIIRLLAVAFNIVFILMGYLVDQIVAYCFVILFLGVLDVRGCNLVNVNLTKFYANPRFVPRADDPDQLFIKQRRRVAVKYWLRKPHIERAIVILACNLFALLVAVSGKVFGYQAWIGFSYIVIIATFVVSEMIITKWRKRRDEVLKRITRHEREIIAVESKRRVAEQ